MAELSQQNRKNWYNTFDDFHKILQAALDNDVEVRKFEIRNNKLNKIKLENFLTTFNCTRESLYEALVVINTTPELIKNDMNVNLLCALFGRHLNSGIHEACFKEYVLEKIKGCTCKKGNKFVITASGIVKKSIATGEMSKTIDYILTLADGKIFYLTLKHGTWCNGGGQDNQRKDIEHTLNLAKQAGLNNVIAICDGDYYNHTPDKNYKFYIKVLKDMFPGQVYTTCEFIDFINKMED